MMRIINTLMTALLLLALTATGAYAQSNAMTHTTLSAAITSISNNAITFTVGSATGFTANTTMAVIDGEGLNIQAVSGTTITASRGFQGTTAMQHNSGAIVLVGPYNAFYDRDPVGGRCSAAAQPYLPFVNLKGHRLWNCNASQWVLQTWPGEIQSGPTSYCTETVGNVAYGSIGTNLVTVAGTIYFGSFEIPKTTRLTSMKAMQGATVGTDKFLYVLYRADGVKLATTALAGVATTGGDAFLSDDLTTPYLATGPARYYFGLQSNGSTDKFRAVATLTFVNLFGNSQTGAFATIPSITTVPTALTADKAPYGCVVATTP